MSEKIDLFKLHRADYQTPTNPVIHRVDRGQYLMIDGRGEPGGETFQDRVGALYAMAFTIKMTRKKDGLGDYVICKLECLWGGSDGLNAFENLPKSEWPWNLAIRTPDAVSQDDVDAARRALLAKGKSRAVADVALSELDEGWCVQMLHVGPYENEPETVAKMRTLAEKNGKVLSGAHHEIYLSDPRRVPEERLKTILRLPVIDR